MRVLFLGSSLIGGGAERMLTVLAGEFSDHGHEVTVFALRRGAEASYPLPPGVRVECLGLIDESNPVGALVDNTLNLMRLRQRVVAVDPACVVSFIDKLNVAILIALAGTGIPVVATEHLVPWFNPMGTIWELLRSATYGSAGCVVAPTGPIRDWVRGRSGGCPVVLPYPVGVPKPKEPRFAGRSQVVFAAGRLVPLKGHRGLIEAFAGLAAEFPSWILEIAGEGPQRPELEAQIRRLHLEGRVRLLGFVDDVPGRMEKASIFALSSEQEAFPLVLGEAMYSGAAVVSTDCPTGPSEMIDPGVSGLLVPVGDVAAMEDALRSLMVDPDLRQRLAEAGRKRSEAWTRWAAVPAWLETVEGVGCPIVL